MKKRFPVVLAILSILTLLLGACVPVTAPAQPAPPTTAPAPETAAPAPTTAPATAPAGTIKLTVWLGPNNTEPFLAIFDRYTKETGVQFDKTVFPVPFEQNLLAKWATGERPDLLQFHAIGNWLVQLNPEENLFDQSDMAFVQNTVAGILDKAGNYKGKSYAAIIDYPFIDGVFYNKKVFSDLGLTVPTNYNDLLALCETIKQKAPNVAPIYTGGGDQWPLQVLAFDMWNDDIKADPHMLDDLNANKIKFTDPRFVAGIAKEKELLDKGCYNKDILTAKYTDEQKNLVEGTAAMVVQGSWIVGNLVDSYGLDKVNATVGFFGLSKDSNIVSWQAVGLGEFYRPKTGDAAKEAAAKAFIDWITGPGYQQYLTDSKQFPVMKGYPAPTGVANALLEANEALQKNSVAQYQQTLQAAYGPFESFLSEMVAGQATPQQVAESLDKEFERSARQQGLPGF